MQKRLMGSIALSAILLTGMVGCGSSSSNTPMVEEEDNDSLSGIISTLQADSDANIAASLQGVAPENKIPFGDGSFSPFERVAVLDVVRDTEGKVDYNATNQKVRNLAVNFALNVANINEPATDNATFKASDWIVIDKKKTDTNLTAADIIPHLIQIPTSKPFNPDLPYSKTNTKKVQLVELCNPEYAGKAAGFKMVGGEEGAKVPNGPYHATALPCEVTIYTDNEAIYVDMLNPETIFTLFFTEVFDDEVMNNENFATAMLALPTQVKKEITTMIHGYLDSTGESYHKTAIKMGPVYSDMSVAKDIPKTAAPYTHFKYTSTGKEFTVSDAKTIAHTIMSVMTIHGQSNAGKQETSLLTALPSQTQETPVNPSWRSARHEPFKVPGGIWVIEACSPPYAKAALNTGEFHTPALPCEIAVKVNPDDNKSIDVSILNPDFMFNALFADGMKDMDADAIASFQNIIDNINGDLTKIVNYSMEHNVSDIDHTTEEIITPIIY